MRNIDIRDSKFGQLTRQPIFIEGYAPTNQISGVTIANCEFVPSNRGITVTNATDVEIVNCRGLSPE